MFGNLKNKTMKGSQELIAHFHKREAELGEKATKFNMFLEGYASGYNDTKAYMIDKACKYLRNRKSWIIMMTKNAI